MIKYIFHGQHTCHKHNTLYIKLYSIIYDHLCLLVTVLPRYISQISKYKTLCIKFYKS